MLMYKGCCTRAWCNQPAKTSKVAARATFVDSHLSKAGVVMVTASDLQCTSDSSFGVRTLIQLLLLMSLHR